MEYKNAVDVVKDSKGNEIKLHDVCKNLATGEIVIVEEGTNKHHKTKGLVAINDVIGLQDWYVSINNSYVELTEEATPKEIDNCKLVYLGHGWWNDKHIQNNYNNYTGVVK